jgi:hypothetical protein
MSGYDYPPANKPFILNNLSGSITESQTADRWEDLRFSLTSTKLEGSKDPTFSKVRDDGAGSQGVFAYAFPHNAEKEVYFEAQMPHSWATGTDLQFHVHWTPGSNGVSQDGATVKWGLEYTVSKNDGLAIPVTQIKYVTDVVEGVDYAGQISGDIVIDGSGLDSSAIFICRFFRDVTVDGNAEAAVWALSVDFHYIASGLGTVNSHYPFGGQ